jgi:hypothetical protein
MKVQDLLNMVTGNPEIAEYDLSFSEYLAIPDSEIGLDDNILHLTFVSDYPCLAIAANDEDKTLRLVMKQSDISLIEQTPDRILKILRENKDRLNDEEFQS